jgi:hypothetical protein
LSLYTTLASLSQTAASNAADGSADAPSTIDQQTNLLASFAARLRDGDLNTAPAVVASASTIVLDGVALSADISGTTNINAITLAQGSWKIVRFSGVLTLTSGASLLLPGGVNITTIAGDQAIFVGRGSGIVACVSYLPYTSPFSSWTATSPTVTASSGTFTSVTGNLRYKTNNKTTFFNLIVTITTNGTAAGGITVTMPFSALAESVISGRETQSTGLACTGTMTASSNILTILRYDNLYAGGTGYRITLNGVLETT